MSNPVPEKLINFRTYWEGEDMIGTADVELPSLEAMTESVSGAGIAGEVDSPTLGHFASMTTTINLRTIPTFTGRIAAQRSHQFDFRGSQQVYNASSGQYETIPVRCVMKATPKNIQLGSFNVGQMTDTSKEYEVTYIKLWVDGVVQVEIDKYNFIALIGGEDFLAGVRRDLGI